MSKETRQKALFEKYTDAGAAAAIAGFLDFTERRFAAAIDRLPAGIYSDVDYLDASLRFPFTDRLSARLVYRYQKETVRDWHYQRVDATPVVLGGNSAALPTAVALDGGPQNFEVSWFGVMLQIKL